MVPKVADSKSHPKVTEVAPKIALQNDAGKNYVSDDSKPLKHSSRANGSTVFARAKDHHKVTQMMPKRSQKRRQNHQKTTLETCLKSHQQILATKQKQRAPQRHPKGTPKSSKNDPRDPPGPPWPHNPAQGAIVPDF